MCVCVCVCVCVFVSTRRYVNILCSTCNISPFLY